MALPSRPAPEGPAADDGVTPPRWPFRPDERTSPRWTYPVLVVILVSSVGLTSWRAGSSLELYYAAGVRSMAQSWHNFFFGAFDPQGTITLDKLPGAFWIQALSVRLFGVHSWAIVAPQVVEGAASVWVLFAVVRRLRGPAAGLLAAGLVAISPVWVALNRGNISDSLFILMLLLAARFLVAALERPSFGRMVVSGLFVALAFQAKMVEAWLLVPVLCVTYLVSAPVGVVRRFIHAAVLTAVGLAASLSWMVVVSAVPAHDRPYVDGSQSNSVFEQVFRYNGFGRVGQPSPNQQLAHTLGIPALARVGPDPGFTRLVTGLYGRDVGWLVPAALIAGVACVLACRRRPRTDPLVVTTLLFGSWAVVFGLFLSVTESFNPYYLAVLTPAMGALLATALVPALTDPITTLKRLFLIVLVVVTCATAVWLLPSHGTEEPSWLTVSVVVLGALSVVAVVARGRGTSRSTGLVGVAVVSALAWVSLVASVGLVADALGPFDTPFQPAGYTRFNQAFFRPTADIGLTRIQAARFGARDLMATQTSALAAPFIFATGDEVLPIGGYTGTIPEPTVSEIRRLVAAAAFHLVLAGPLTDDPRIGWIAAHCQNLGPPPAVPGVFRIGALEAYFCVKSDVYRPAGQARLGGVTAQRRAIRATSSPA